MLWQYTISSPLIEGLLLSSFFGNCQNLQKHAVFRKHVVNCLLGFGTLLSLESSASWCCDPRTIQPWSCL